MANSLVEKHRYRRFFVDLKRFYRLKRFKVYTGIILSIIAVTFFMAFAIRPTLITITGLVAKINDNRVVAQKLQNKINALSLAQSEYHEIKSKLSLVDDALPENSELSILIRQLESLGRKNAVIIDSVQIDNTPLKGKGEKIKPKTFSENLKAGRDTEVVGFSFSASGSYQSLKSFLDDLKNTRRLVLVDNFIIQAGKGGEDLTLGLEAEACYLPNSSYPSSNQVSKTDNEGISL